VAANNRPGDYIMSQIILSNAEVLGVSVQKSGDKTYTNMFIFDDGERPDVYRVSIRHDDPKRQIALTAECDAMTRKKNLTLVLNEFQGKSGAKFYSYVGTLESFSKPRLATAS